NQATLRGHQMGVTGVAFGADGSLLASCSADGTARVWRADSGEPAGTFESGGLMLSGVSLSPDGRIPAGGFEGLVYVWDVGQGRRVFGRQAHRGRATAVAFSPDGSRIATCGSDKMVRLWDGQTGAEVRTLPGHSCLVNAVAFSPDGRTLVSGGTDA